MLRPLQNNRNDLGRIFHGIFYELGMDLTEKYRLDSYRLRTDLHSPCILSSPIQVLSPLRSDRSLYLWISAVEEACDAL